MNIYDPCTLHQCPSPSPSQSSADPSATTTIYTVYNPSDTSATTSTGTNYTPSTSLFGSSGTSFPVISSSPISSSVSASASPASPARTTIISSLSSQTSSATPVVDAVTSGPNVGAIAGGVIGGVIFLVCVVLGVLLYLRARKRKRTAPSSEFMNSLRAGATPVLRLDSGAAYTPALPEKGGYSHYSSSTPPPFMQNSYYTSAAAESMKFPDAMMMSDIPSARPSVEKPLHPQRFSDHPTNDSYADKARHVSASIGSRRELWSSDAETFPSDLPARQSLRQGRDALEFAPLYSTEEPSPSPLFSTSPQESAFHQVADQQSPPRVVSSTLQPLRRRESTY